MNTVLRLLIADEAASDVDLELHALRTASLQFDHQVVSTEPALRSALHDFAPDLILCDFAISGFDGISPAAIARELRPTTPLILVSRSITEDRVVTAIQSGAVNFVMKSNLPRLHGAVILALESARELQRLRDAERRVKRLTRTKDVVSAVNSAIVRLRDKAELLREACRIATETGGFAYSFVMTIAADTQRVEVPAFAGPSTWSNSSLRDYLQRIVDDLQAAPGVLAASLRDLRPASLDVWDYGELPTQKELLDSGIASMASFPLIIAGRAVGALNLAAYGRSRFDGDEMELIADLTNNLSFALDLLEKQQSVDYLAYYDPLTELPNRTLFTERLVNALSIARRAGHMTALILLDIEHLSNVNATLGQRVGDELLRQCAGRLRESAGIDQVARLAGDRFALCLPVLSDLQPVIDLLGDDGMRIFNKPFSLLGHEIAVRVKAGCALFPQDGTDAETLNRNAEAALENAQSSNIEFYSATLSRELSERIDLEARLRRAAREEEFILHYQPKVDVITRELVGVEALLRWRDPDRPDALIFPDEFIEALEQTGLIVAVGRWVLHEAARQYARWRAAGLRAPRIAVNLSARQLLEADIVEQVRSAVADCGNACGIDLEVTESMLMQNLEDAAAMLRDIRAFGVEIALDDFGTGYSSLAVLHRLPISALKIDRSFIRGMTDDVGKTSMISTVISLAHSLAIKVIAEGVEVEEEARLLRLLRCDQMQGYLVARPGPPEALASMLGASGVAASC